MSKFKIGDKVRVKSEHHLDPNVIFILGRIIPGEVFVVYGVGENGCYLRSDRLEGAYLFDFRLELAEDDNQSGVKKRVSLDDVQKSKQLVDQKIVELQEARENNLKILFEWAVDNSIGYWIVDRYEQHGSTIGVMKVREELYLDGSVVYAMTGNGFESQRRLDAEFFRHNTPDCDLSRAIAYKFDAHMSGFKI